MRALNHIVLLLGAYVQGASLEATVDALGSEAPTTDARSTSWFSWWSTSGPPKDETQAQLETQTGEQTSYLWWGRRQTTADLSGVTIDTTGERTDVPPTGTESSGSWYNPLSYFWRSQSTAAQNLEDRVDQVSSEIVSQPETEEVKERQLVRVQTEMFDSIDANSIAIKITPRADKAAKAARFVRSKKNVEPSSGVSLASEAASMAKRLLGKRIKKAEREADRRNMDSMRFLDPSFISEQNMIQEARLARRMLEELLIAKQASKKGDLMNDMKSLLDARRRRYDLEYATESQVTEETKEEVKEKTVLRAAKAPAGQGPPPPPPMENFNKKSEAKARTTTQKTPQTRVQSSKDTKDSSAQLMDELKARFQVKKKKSKKEKGRK